MTQNSSYSVLVYLSLLVTVLPAFWAWFSSNLVESGPRWLCLGAGVALSALIAYLRARARKNAAHAAPTQRSTAHNSPPPDFSGYQIARELLLVVGPPCWLLSSLLLGNRFLDDAAPTTHSVELKAYHERRKAADAIEVNSWHPDQAQLELSLSSLTMPGIHRATPLGTPLLITTQPGAFGWEWIVSVRVE